MKLPILCVLAFFVINLLQAQQMLVLTDPQTNRTVEIRAGNKVLLAFKTTQREVDNQPGDVFILRQQDLQDSTFVHVKTRIRSITDSTIILKNGREMRISKLAGIRKLSLGRQVARTAAKGAGLLAYAAGLIFFLENIGETSEPTLPFLPSIGLIAAGVAIDASVKDEVPARHLQRWRVSVRNSPQKTSVGSK